MKRSELCCSDHHEKIGFGSHLPTLRTQQKPANKPCIIMSQHQQASKISIHTIYPYSLLPFMDVWLSTDYQPYESSHLVCLKSIWWSSTITTFNLQWKHPSGNISLLIGTRTDDKKLSNIHSINVSKIASITFFSWVVFAALVAHCAGEGERYAAKDNRLDSKTSRPRWRLRPLYMDPAC